MQTKVVLLGGVTDSVTRPDLLARLQSVRGDVEWDWVIAYPDKAFAPAKGELNQLLDTLRKRKAASKLGGELQPANLIVVKLFDLHGRTNSQLYEVECNPVLVPHDCRTGLQLVEWLLANADSIFPRAEWWAGETEAALVSILCKLLKNKSWNASVQGHAWTKEHDLLGQSPVARNDRPKVAIEARRMLPTLEGGLLLTKGAGQGKTPKEWSIHTGALPKVKQSINLSSIEPLKQISHIEGLVERAIADDQKIYRMDVEVVSEKVHFVCKQRD